MGYMVLFFVQALAFSKRFLVYQQISIFLLPIPRRYFFCIKIVVFLSCACHAFASVHCCLVVTCWERADLLARVCGVKLCFVGFPCGILGQVWYLIVSIPDLCPLSYFGIFCPSRPVVPINRFE